MEQSDLERRILDKLESAFTDLQVNGVSVVANVGLGDRHGIIRLLPSDIARIAAAEAIAAL